MSLITHQAYSQLLKALMNNLHSFFFLILGCHENPSSILKSHHKASESQRLTAFLIERLLFYFSSTHLHLQYRNRNRLVNTLKHTYPTQHFELHYENNVMESIPILTVAHYVCFQFSLSFQGNLLTNKVNRATFSSFSCVSLPKHFWISVAPSLDMSFSESGGWHRVSQWYKAFSLLLQFN